MNQTNIIIIRDKMLIYLKQIGHGYVEKSTVSRFSDTRTLTCIAFHLDECFIVIAYLTHCMSETRSNLI